jgi:hypothetical protein
MYLTAHTTRRVSEGMWWQFSSRELAILLWTGVFAAWVLSMPSVRASAAGVLRHLFHWKLSIPMALLAGYTYGIVLLLRKAGLWAPSLTKDTIVWFLFSGLALAASAIEHSK